MSGRRQLRGAPAGADGAGVSWVAGGSCTHVYGRGAGRPSAIWARHRHGRRSTRGDPMGGREHLFGRRGCTCPGGRACHRSAREFAAGGAPAHGALDDRFVRCAAPCTANLPAGHSFGESGASSAGSHLPPARQRAGGLGLRADHQERTILRGCGLCRGYWRRPERASRRSTLCRVARADSGWVPIFSDRNLLMIKHMLAGHWSFSADS
jgi:hypothetical protein